MNLKGVRSTFDGNATENQDYTRGVKFTPFQSDVVSDPSIVVMKNLRYNRSVKQALVGGVNLTKQFDGRLLFFTFPLSLKRETVYATYNHFNIQDFGQSTKDFSTHSKFNEYTAGVNFELIVLNKLPIPIGFEYVYNKEACDEKANEACDEGRFGFATGFDF